MPLVLQQTDRDCLRECLESVFALDNPRSILGSILLPVELIEVPGFATPREYLDWIIIFAETDGFKRTPPIILSLLAKKAADPMAHALTAKVNAMYEQHRRDMAVAKDAVKALDPFRPIIMRRQQPVLGRGDAAKALQKLTLADDAAVFVVRGVTRSGRSYTAEIINYMATQLGLLGRAALQVASVELNDEIVDYYEAVSLIASSLVSDIDRREIKRGRPRAAQMPPLLDPAPKWLHDVAQWLVAAAANTGETWWLVLDRLTPGSASLKLSIGSKGDPVDQFIQILARKIARLGSDNQIRLVVLGYDRDFPAELAPAVVWEELPHPTSVGQVEVSNFFRQFFAMHGGAEDQVVEGATAEVFARLPPSDDRLAALNASIREVIGDLVA